MKIITNLFINFCVGFISDIILNDLSTIKNLNSINSLSNYFKNHYITIAAIYAGITTMICILITIIINKFIKINYYLLTFIVGYFIDILIEKCKIINHLDNYYRVVGSGIWGGLAILFSSVISTLINIYILPIIYECRK